MVNEKHFSRVKRLIDDATAKGAAIATGGVTEIGDKFIAPTLLTNVSETSEIMSDEIFGPVLPVISYTDVSKPISRINENPKPLALYVYSKNDTTIDRVITETSTGGSCINMSMLHFSHANLPFGGVNNSGIGASHGIFGFRAFSHERAILRDRFSTIPMLFPPYTNRVKSLVKFTLKYLT
jgi:aldehyde dehydrogenase (NAD+)